MFDGRGGSSKELGQFVLKNSLWGLTISSTKTHRDVAWPDAMTPSVHLVSPTERQAFSYTNIFPPFLSSRLALLGVPIGSALPIQISIKPQPRHNNSRIASCLKVCDT